MLVFRMLSFSSPNSILTMFAALFSSLTSESLCKTTRDDALTAIIYLVTVYQMGESSYPIFNLAHDYYQRYINRTKQNPVRFPTLSAQENTLD